MKDHCKRTFTQKQTVSSAFDLPTTDQGTKNFAIMGGENFQIVEKLYLQY